MKPVSNRLGDYNFEKLVDLLIRLVIPYLLIALCIDILRPFVTILMWGTVIAVAVYPPYNRLVKLLHGRKIIASVIVTLLMISILMIPSWLIGESLYKGIEHIRLLHSQGQSLIPPPGDSVKTWPSVFKPIVNLWENASINLQAVVIQYKDEVGVAGTWVLKSLASIGKGVVQFVASIFIAGIFLVYSGPIGISLLKIFKKLSGKNGESLANLSVGTIRSVFKGVLGVGFIQAGLAGIGYFIAGVPYAGLWTVISLFLSIIQIGIWPVAIPIVIYMFFITNTLTATLLTIWMIPVILSDNILRPILMGMGAPVPMLVIFLGAIGGFITSGFIGLFLGAIVLSIGYKLFIVWMDVEAEN